MHICSGLRFPFNYNFTRIIFYHTCQNPRTIKDNERRQQKRDGFWRSETFIKRFKLNKTELITMTTATALKNRLAAGENCSNYLMLA